MTDSTCVGAAAGGWRRICSGGAAKAIKANALTVAIVIEVNFSWRMALLVRRTVLVEFTIDIAPGDIALI
ncbi:MAG: hypothetical protein R3F11_02395 [Verrucomicrobiales bacterium]